MNLLKWIFGDSELEALKLGMVIKDDIRLKYNVCYVPLPQTESDKISIKHEWVYDWTGSGFGWTWATTTIKPIDAPQTKPEGLASRLNSLADS